MIMMLLAQVLALALLPVVVVATPPDVHVDVEVDLRGSSTDFAHYWKRSFGSGHAALRCVHVHLDTHQMHHDQRAVGGGGGSNACVHAYVRVRVFEGHRCCTQLLILP